MFSYVPTYSANVPEVLHTSFWNVQRATKNHQSRVNGCGSLVFHLSIPELWAAAAKREEIRSFAQYLLLSHRCIFWWFVLFCSDLHERMCLAFPKSIFRAHWNQKCISASVTGAPTASNHFIFTVHPTNQQKIWKRESSRASLRQTKLFHFVIFTVLWWQMTKLSVCPFLFTWRNSLWLGNIFQPFTVGVKLKSFQQTL